MVRLLLGITILIIASCKQSTDTGEIVSMNGIEVNKNLFEAIESAFWTT